MPSDAFDGLTKVIAGAVAGVSETLITYPAEFAKTRRQLYTTTGPQPSSSSSPRPSPPSSLAILRTTLSTSGLPGIYSGVQSLALSNAAMAGVRFLAFETARDALEGPFGGGKSRSNPAVTAAAGLAAGAAESVLVVTPGEAVKTRMIHQAQAAQASAALSQSVGGGGSPRPRPSPPPGLGRTVRDLVLERGVRRGLWSGLTPVLGKQATNSAVRFTAYEALAGKVGAWWPGMLRGGAKGEGKKLKLTGTLLVGGASGVLTVYASMPFDTIKTNMQRVDSRYKGMLDCAADIFRTQGIFAFWRGSSPRLVRLILSSGITFTVYEQVVTAFRGIKKS